MPSTYFLSPGYGAQGGDAADAVECFNADGYGAIVSSSRAITYAYRYREDGSGDSEDGFSIAARTASIAMKEGLTSALKQNDKYPW